MVAAGVAEIGADLDELASPVEAALEIDLADTRVVDEPDEPETVEEPTPAGRRGSDENRVR